MSSRGQTAIGCSGHGSGPGETLRPARGKRGDVGHSVAAAEHRILEGVPRYTHSGLEVVQVALVGQAVAAGSEHQPALERQTGHLKRAGAGEVEADVLPVISLRLGRFVVPAAAD